MRIIFLIFFILLFGSCNNKQEQYVLLISFDGFRSDYLDWYDTPNMDSFINKGVKSEGLIPVFVSKTFPNHYRIKDALVLADESWYIKNQAISSSTKPYANIINGGTHGYDNQLKSMHALFSPYFLSGATIPPFENINIYPLICHILNIKPYNKFDGNLKNVQNTLIYI